MDEQLNEELKVKQNSSDAVTPPEADNQPDFMDEDASLKDLLKAEDDEKSEEAGQQVSSEKKSDSQENAPKSEALSASELEKKKQRSDELKAISANLNSLPRVQKKSQSDREFSMILKMHGREFSQALMTIAGTRQRSGRLWLTVGATLIVIILLCIQVYYRHRELNLGYELSSAIAQREALLEENRKLRIELRVLSRRERLEPLAGRQLGMANIKPEQVFIYDVTKKKTTNTGTMPGKRLDGLDDVKRIGED